MSIFKKLFGSKKPGPAPGEEQAVLVFLDGDGLPDEVYENNDLDTLETELRAAIESSGAGEYDGHEFQEERVVVYMYSPSADALFAAVEPVLRSYPLCRGAKVLIRSGPPGAPEREIGLPAV